MVLAAVLTHVLFKLYLTGDALKGCLIDFSNCTLANSIEILQLVSPFVSQLQVQKMNVPPVSPGGPKFNAGFNGSEHQLAGDHSPHVSIDIDNESGMRLLIRIPQGNIYN